MFFSRKTAAPNAILTNIALLVLAAGSVVYAAYIAVRYSQQAPLDFYSFRQTQTAITAYWLYKEGFKLAYETPVAGFPWSVPFEFPLYQYIVSILAKIAPISLNAAGRLVSFTFLVLCLVPARAVIRDLKLGERSFPIFTILLLSSPIYLYWGRTFMIETTAVYFSLAAISLFVKIIKQNESLGTKALFLICMSLAVLQKATTGFPVLAILGIVYFLKSLRDLRQLDYGKEWPSFTTRRLFFALAYIGIPLALGIAWTYYTDQIKALNPLGSHLTSSALQKWNWGTINQRLSKDIYENVIWHRIFLQNLGGTLGVAILLWGFISNVKQNVRVSILVSAAMGFAPIFLFTNLHLIHTYYQSANLIFLIFSTAIALSHIASNGLASLILTAVIATSNIYWFDKEFKPTIETTFDRNNSRDIAVAEIMKREMPEKMAMVIFGNDWSSSISYLAERKSYTVPQFVPNYNRLAADPTNFIATSELGGVVLCDGVEHPTLTQLEDWSSARGWRVARVNSCYVSLPASRHPPASE
jgi:hypothetical protein